MKKINFYILIFVSILLYGCQHRAQVRSTSVDAAIEKPVYFEFGRWVLSPSEEENLLSKIKQLKSYPNATILLEGHTDSIGDEEKNLELGDRRARYVKWKLSGEGIAPERVVVTSLGESQADIHNLSEKVRQQERRVDFKVK